MIAFELEGVEIDHCVACGGVWLDAGELELIARAAGADAARLEPAPPAIPATPKTAAKSKRRCPRCGRRMALSAFGEPADACEPAIEIDVCRAGHGVWLDRGELRAIVARCAPASDGAGPLARTLEEMFRFELQNPPQGDRP